MNEITVAHSVLENRAVPPFSYWIWPSKSLNHCQFKHKLLCLYKSICSRTSIVIVFFVASSSHSFSGTARIWLWRIINLTTNCRIEWPLWRHRNRIGAICAIYTWDNRTTVTSWTNNCGSLNYHCWLLCGWWWQRRLQNYCVVVYGYGSRCWTFAISVN